MIQSGKKDLLDFLYIIDIKTIKLVGPCNKNRDKQLKLNIIINVGGPHMPSTGISKKVLDPD